MRKVIILITTIPLFFYRIFFRFKYKFPYKDSWSLDYTFIKWIHPRIVYYITTKIKLHVIEDNRVKDYNEMLDLIEWLKDKYECHDNESLKKYKRFCSLFRKHSDGLWI